MNILVVPILSRDHSGPNAQLNVVEVKNTEKKFVNVNLLLLKLDMMKSLVEESRELKR